MVIFLPEELEEKNSQLTRFFLTWDEYFHNFRTWKGEPPQLCILLNQLKIKPCWFLNPQQSVATVTPGKKDTVLENPTCSNKRNNHMHSLPD